MQSPSSRLRTLVVDDEPLAREGLRALLAELSEVEVVGEAAGGAAAIDAVRRWAPDLLLLDISMPEVDGFELLEQLGAEAPVYTIFVTAHDHYAVRAFEVHAVDYLLKPVSRERLQRALDRVRQWEASGSGEPRSANRSPNVRATQPKSFQAGSSAATAEPAAGVSRLAVRSVGRVRFVRVETIDWIEAADYYSNLHVRGSSLLIRQSMKALESSLDPSRFVRIHRSAIVNVDKVREVQTRRQGGHTVTLLDGTSLKLSRSRRRALERLLPTSPG